MSKIDFRRPAFRFAVMAPVLSIALVASRELLIASDRDNGATTLSTGTAFIGEMIDIGGGLAIYAADGPEGVELRQTDGTVGGSTLIKDIRPGAEGSWPTHFIRYKNMTYFVADDGTHGVALWRTDGTEAGTIRVFEAWPGDDMSPGKPMVFSRRLLFTANHPDYGIELWITDGTELGTQLLSDIRPGPFGSGADRFIRADKSLYFVADDGIHGRELWKTEGTADSTRLVKDVRPAIEDLDPLQMTVFPARPLSSITPDGTSNHLLFFAKAYPATWELWKTDGTERGTELVRMIPEDASNSVRPPHSFSVVNAIAFFIGHASFLRTGGFEGLWKTDGTTAGTSHVIPYTIGGTEGPRFPENLCKMGGVLYFSARTLAVRDLWRSDGTATGTYQFTFPDRTNGLTPENITVVDSLLFFNGYRFPEGNNLWKSDGTTGGTVLVKDFQPGSSNRKIACNLRTFNGKLRFVATLPALGEELWVSDGTAAGTFNLADIRPGSASSSPHSFRPFAGGMLFETVGDTVAHELWRTDGTPAGTYKIESFDPQ